MALPNGDLITTPFDPQMAYPSDRRMQIDTLNSRDSISMFIRWEGMDVYVLENKTKYILQGGVSNEYWKPYGIGSGTGGTTFVGQFETADLLPTSGRSAGDYAFVGTGDDFVQYNWDNISGQWVMAEGQTDMASEFFHIGYKTPLRRPVIFPLFPKDVLVETSGDFVFAPATAVARFIFVGEVDAIRGVEYATADREIKLVNRTGSDIPLRDKASGIPSGSGFDFGGTDYTWVNGLEITLKGTGTYWQLAPNNQIAFSDHLDSVNAQVSVGSDGLSTITGLIDAITKEVISIEEVNTFIDGTTMDDTKVDGYYYFKVLDKFFVRSTFKKEQVINVKDLGFVGDNVTDNASKFAELESILSKIKRTVIFPPSLGYYSTRQLHIPAGCDVIMYGRITYGGSSYPALRVGTSGSNNSYRVLMLRVYNQSLSNWDDMSVRGIEIINAYTCKHINIVEAFRFTVGAVCIADGSGFVYNKRIDIGDLRDNKISLKLEAINGGWVNENEFFGGRFWVTSSTNKTKERYGIWISSPDASYTNNNNNIFHSPSFEMGSPNAGIESIPIVVEDGVNNTVERARAEGVGSILARTMNASANNYFDFTYGPNSGNVDEIGTFASSQLFIRNLWQNNPQFGFDIYNSGDLSKRCCEYNSTTLYVEDELFLGNYGNENIYKTRSSTASKLANGISLSSFTSIGVRVDTRLNKSFTVIKNIVQGSPNSGRVIVRCFDANGTVLSGSNPKHIKGVPSSTPANITTFGGAYRQSSDTQSPLFFKVSDDVAFVDIMHSSGSNQDNLHLASFSIKSLDRPTTIINPYSKKGLYASEAPTSSNYEIGTIIYNDQTSGYVGWKYRGSGIWDGFGGVKPIQGRGGSGTHSIAVRSSWEPVFNNLTSPAGNVTVTTGEFLTSDQIDGVVTGGAKTFVGDGVTLRIPSGGSATVNQYETFTLKFLSPTEAVLTIVKPQIPGPTILSATATLNFPVIAIGETSTLTATVTGAALLDPVVVSAPASVYNANNSTVDAWVSAANTVTIRISNNGESSIDPEEGQFKIKVFK